MPSLSSREKVAQVTKESSSGGHSYADYYRKSSFSLAFRKVVEVYPGKDGHVRSVKLQVGKKQLVRLIENSVRLNWTNIMNLTVIRILLVRGGFYNMIL